MLSLCIEFLLSWLLYARDIEMISESDELSALTVVVMLKLVCIPEYRRHGELISFT